MRSLFPRLLLQLAPFLIPLAGLAVICSAGELQAQQSTAQTTQLVYIGTYADKDEEGIHVCRLDMTDGNLTRVNGVSGIKNPSFQALHPNRKFLYSVSESQDYQGKRMGSVSAFAMDEETGLLTLLNEQPSLGAGPCHITTDLGGTNVIVANYGSGSLAVLPIKPDGSLDIAHNLVQHTGSSVHPRQKSPHAHCVNIDAQGRHIVSADLGLDKVLVYRFNPENHTLTPNPEMPFLKVKPGAGPRHFTFHPAGTFGYIINELNSTVTACKYDGETGTLIAFQYISTLPADFSGENTTAEIAVSPDGRFLYGSNRGHNSIAVFAVDAESGMLTAVSHHATLGEQPRNFAIDPTGQYLLAANQRTGNVVVFQIDRDSGRLTPNGKQIELQKPVCITFLTKPRQR